MSITDLRGFIKPLAGARRRDGLILLIIVLSAIGGFALGRLSASSGTSLIVEQPAAAGGFLGGKEQGTIATSEDTFLVPEGVGSVVASKTGSKYHFPWCGGARSIKEENKIWFETAEIARRAGYLPAGNCKGLK